MPGVLTRWDPYAELADLRSRFDRMFGDLRAEREWMPSIDVERSEGNLIMRADVPGIKPEELKIEVEDDVLTVSGSHEETSEEKKKDYVRRERRYGAFSRSLSLPAGVDAAGITAETRDGVLEVKIPLPEEKAKQKTVTITPKAG
jgi:HSP20 family protein